MTRRIAATLTVALLLTLALPVLGDHGDPTPQGNCPEAGKVNSGAAGNGIVFPAGTHVCIKGGQTIVFVTADGVATLQELLGTGQDVSHYTVIQTPTTQPTETTWPEDTTTTTTPPSTVPTTSSSTTTTVATPVTTTPAPPTTAPLLGTPQTTTTAIQLIIVDPPPSTLLIDTTTTSPLLVQASDTLPRTGVNTGNLPWLALAALVAGGGLVRLTKGQES